MKSRWTYLAVGTAFILLIAFAVWKRGVDRGLSGRSTVGAIRVASILGLTGENAAYGIRMRRGLELAADTINARGGVSGRRLQLTIDDSQWDPARGVSIYRRLHDVEGVSLFAAICGSTVAATVIEASRRDSVVIVDAISTAPSLTTRGGPHYFRVCASDEEAGKNNVAWAARDGARSYSIVYVTDEWGESYKDALVAAIASRGGTAVTIAVAPQTRELRAEATRAREANADAVFLVLYASLAAPFAQQARALGLRGALYGGDNLSSTDFAVAGPEATEGVRVSLPASADSAESASFNADYRSRYHEEPDVFALKSYDALRLLADAVGHAGTNPASVAAYLRSMPPYRGASGAISFDEHGGLREQRYRRMVYRAGALQELTP